jgi:hypothetical protein
MQALYPVYAAYLFITVINIPMNTISYRDFEEELNTFFFPPSSSAFT